MQSCRARNSLSIGCFTSIWKSIIDFFGFSQNSKFSDVFALSRLCTIRISFCKGWGTHYRRSTVLRAPVWFQAHFHSPMRWIDSVLNSMGAPPRTCSSRTWFALERICIFFRKTIFFLFWFFLLVKSADAEFIITIPRLISLKKKMWFVKKNN